MKINPMAIILMILQVGSIVIMTETIEFLTKENKILW
jgi:hypothetical protein